ncbi:hypothetical protein CMV_015267 [Castanea mollissima]|uniref:Uncharacterized protein n=1 Tax=Castanea mollissima TaxID=60419 RepID=A0A8J4QWF7_9ROSI|nr:hypothetical protein CMV_015267 [Castanea mollissima]
MGREIVQQESEELQQRSRIWRYEDAHKLLTGNMGSKKIRSITLLSPERTEVSLKAVFKRMKNLKFLVGNVHFGEALDYLPDELRFLEWRESPLSLSSKCCLPRQLVVFKISKSNIILENVVQKGFRYENLKMISLNSCESITKLPDLCCPNLEKLNLDDCKKLIEEEEDIPSAKLRLACNSFNNFSEPTGFQNVTSLTLSQCPGIKGGLDSWMQPNYFPALRYLDLSDTGIDTIPESISRFTTLQVLKLRDCKNLRHIPRLPQSIRTVDAQNCYQLDTQSRSRLLNQFGEILGILPNTIAQAATFSIANQYLILPAIEIPELLKFNHHQSVGNSVSFLNASVVPRNPMHLWINALSTMGNKIQAVLESDADCEEEAIDQPMLDVPKNTTCPALDGFESDSNSGNEAPNPGDGK